MFQLTNGESKLIVSGHFEALILINIFTGSKVQELINTTTNSTQFADIQ